MNLKQFSGSEIDLDPDWEITDAIPDIEHVYKEMLWELKQYEGDTADDFAVLHDKTIYQILLIFKKLISKGNAEGELLNDLGDLCQDDEVT